MQVSYINPALPTVINTGVTFTADGADSFAFDSQVTAGALYIIVNTTHTAARLYKLVSPIVAPTSTATGLTPKEVWNMSVDASNNIWVFGVNLAETQSYYNIFSSSLAVVLGQTSLGTFNFQVATSYVSGTTATFYFSNGTTLEVDFVTATISGVVTGPSTFLGGAASSYLKLRHVRVFLSCHAAIYLRWSYLPSVFVQ